MEACENLEHAVRVRAFSPAWKELAGRKRLEGESPILQQEGDVQEVFEDIPFFSF
jgi:hypothetical protein